MQMEFMRQALTMFENRKIDVKPMMTHEYPLEEINTAFREMKEKPEGYIKGYVRIGK